MNKITNDILYVYKRKLNMSFDETLALPVCDVDIFIEKYNEEKEREWELKKEQMEAKLENLKR